MLHTFVGTSAGITMGMVGNATYTLPAKGYTQYFTFGNGGSLAYGDGVTPESPKSYNNFSAVMWVLGLPETLPYSGHGGQVGGETDLSS